MSIYTKCALNNWNYDILTHSRDHLVLDKSYSCSTEKPFNHRYFIYEFIEPCFTIFLLSCFILLTLNDYFALHLSCIKYFFFALLIYGSYIFSSTYLLLHNFHATPPPPPQQSTVTFLLTFSVANTSFS